ncbi:hypothetical protein [Pseudoalteromonas rubra]|uniref:hypothetical protein n=1 Tax=Pseudoalteromonas rubra TaxID=43658 RepID=UPI000F787A2A|nr:hypothetical protein [Pseudoalteromonas rubra]
MEMFSHIPGFVKYLTAGLGALLAILGLFIDKEAPYFKLIAPLFILLVILLSGVQAVEGIAADNSSKQAAKQRERLLVLLDSTSTSSLKTSSYLSDILLSQPQILRDFGISEKRAGKQLDELSTSELVEGQILEANRYRGELIAQRAPSKRLQTTVWYYNKELDSAQLQSALKETGLNITNKIAQRNQADDPTNAVWFGPNVNFNDYKVVLVSLIRAGIDIKRTGPACKALHNKVGVIEVGSSDLAAGLADGIVRPTKSIEQIRNATSFTDLSDFTCPP